MSMLSASIQKVNVTTNFYLSTHQYDVTHYHTQRTLDICQHVCVLNIPKNVVWYFASKCNGHINPFLDVSLQILLIQEKIERKMRLQHI